MKIKDNYFIYTAGGMGNLTFKEQNSWRTKLRDCLEDFTESEFYKVHIINPVDYYNFQEKRYETQREVMNFDLHKVKQSNLVIVNFNDPKSLGTMAEIATAYERRIPVIGLNEGNVKLHPWQIEMCERIFDDMDEMTNYITEFYLN